MFLCFEFNSAMPTFCWRKVLPVAPMNTFTFRWIFCASAFWKINKKIKNSKNRYCNNPNIIYPDPDDFARHHIGHNPVAEPGAGAAEAVGGRQHEAGVEDGAAAGLEVAVLARDDHQRHPRHRTLRLLAADYPLTVIRPSLLLLLGTFCFIFCAFLLWEGTALLVQPRPNLWGVRLWWLMLGALSCTLSSGA